MSDDTYNGWKNRETWAAALHLGNDRGLYEMVREWAADLRADAPDREEDNWTEAQFVTFKLADRIKDFFEELAIGEEFGAPSEDVRSMLYDVGSLWRVEWEDVAESFVEED